MVVVRTLDEDGVEFNRTDWMTGVLKVLFDFVVAAMTIAWTALVIFAGIMFAGTAPTFLLLVPLLHLGTASLFSAASKVVTPSASRKACVQRRSHDCAGQSCSL